MTRRAGRRRGALLAAAFAVLPGCADAEPLSGADDAAAGCSIRSENEQIVALMRDAYLWYKEVPDVDPAAYTSPDALLDALLYKQIDKWSYVAKKSESESYYNDGIRVGIGLRMRHGPDNVVRIGLVYEGSPADSAGLSRGDVIVALNGKTTAEIDAGGLWDTILGEDVDGVAVTMTIQGPSGAASDVTLVKEPFVITSVPVREVIHDDGGRVVGYLFVDRFISPTSSELREAFRSFQHEGVDDLILDLRYNGGGLIDVAAELGGLIGGALTAGETFNNLVFNDKHKDWNKAQVFEDSSGALDLPRVVVLTSSSTASASELLINGLRPFLDVTLIGDTTYGKPVGMNAWTICDLVVRPISFRMLNADGQGDFYEGLGPDCIADDNLTVPLGNPDEASLAEALHFLRAGSCSINAAHLSRAPDTSSRGRTRSSSTALPLRGLRGWIDVL